MKDDIYKMEWFQIPIEQLEDILRVSEGKYIIPVPKGEETSSIVVTENDDVFLLRIFEEAQFDRSKAFYHKDGLYKYIEEVVTVG